MSGHPLHGTKPLAEKLRVAAQFDTTASSMGFFLHKLQRRDPATGRVQVHPTAGGNGRPCRFMPAPIDHLGRPVGFSQAAEEWAAGFPGWELRRE